MDRIKRLVKITLASLKGHLKMLAKAIEASQTARAEQQRRIMLGN